MGYYTNYSGEITIDPAINSQERDRLAKLLGITRPTEGDVFNPPAEPTAADLKLKRRVVNKKGTSPDDMLWAWVLEPDRLLPPEDEVKGHETEAGLVLAHRWLTDNGHKVEGEIEWEGESNDDSGTYYIHPEHGVEAVADVRDNPGPSWVRGNLKSAVK